MSGYRMDQGLRALQEGKNALDQQRFKDAEVHFARAVKRLSDRSHREALGQAHFGLGQSLWRQERLGDALDHYRAAEGLVADPEMRAVVVSRWGTCLHRLGRRGEALQVWDRGLEEARRHASPCNLVHALSLVAWGHRDVTGRADIQRACYNEMLSIVDEIKAWEDDWVLPIVTDIIYRAIDQRDLDTLKEWQARLRRPFPVSVIRKLPTGVPVLVGLEVDSPDRPRLRKLVDDTLEELSEHPGPDTFAPEARADASGEGDWRSTETADVVTTRDDVALVRPYGEAPGHGPGLASRATRSCTGCLVDLMMYIGIAGVVLFVTAFVNPLVGPKLDEETVLGVSAGFCCLLALACVAFIAVRKHVGFRQAFDSFMEVAKRILGLLGALIVIALLLSALVRAGK
jgi:hypothetical protein